MLSPIDGLLRPVHQWVWGDFDRRVRKLLAFAEVETDGGRDILRAAELTPDPLLRRLYLEHAIDELHHGNLFRERGAALLRQRAAGSTASRITGSSRSFTWPRRQRRGVSRSTASSWTTIPPRAPSSNRSCAMKS